MMSCYHPRWFLVISINFKVFGHGVVLTRLGNTKIPGALRCGASWKNDRLLPIGDDSRISQNNIAKEAGCDPSALRKILFPTLIAEIQRWIIENPSDSPASPRQAMLAQRCRNLSLKDKIEILTSERDHALSLLVEADERIVELTLENSELKAKLPNPSVTHLRKRP